MLYTLRFLWAIVEERKRVVESVVFVEQYARIRAPGMPWSDPHPTPRWVAVETIHHAHVYQETTVRPNVWQYVRISWLMRY